jgi:hypothetical protein
MINNQMFEALFFVIGFNNKLYKVSDFENSKGVRFCLKNTIFKVIEGKCFATYKCIDGQKVFEVCGHNFSSRDWLQMVGGLEIQLTNAMIEIRQNESSALDCIDLVYVRTPRGIYKRVWSRHKKVWVRQGLISHETYGILELIT